ncbi:MAG: DUF4433 domain-containing protein [Chloroflexota bacterium]|nr:DUF4433 domain-containing protein [Chloroflexota bacterium]
MEQSNYLDGYIYHMVHIRNLPSIFRQGALLSKEMLGQKGIDLHSIAYESVQDLRERIFIWDFSMQRYRSLHSYVPFYFCKRSPMLYVQQKAGIQDQIVFIVVNRAILKEQGVLFTDGNASLQRLSRNRGEKVGIVPATNNSPCQRKYRPGGPHGTNERCSNFYSDIILLEDLDWDVINGVPHIEFEEGKRIRSAEVLVPDSLALKKVQCIAVNTEKMAQIVRTMATEYGLSEFAPFISLDPSLFL